MVLWLKKSAADFETRFGELLAAKRESAEDVNQAVAAIIARIRSEKDAALIDLTQRFDRVDLTKAGIRVSAAEIGRASCRERV